MDRITDNKWFKLFKYTTGALLILASIIALFAAWYSSQADSVVKAGDVAKDSVGYSVVFTEKWRVLNLVLGFLGLILAVVLLSNRTNKVLVLSLAIVSFVFTIIIATFGSLGIIDSSTVTEVIGTKV